MKRVYRRPIRGLRWKGAFVRRRSALWLPALVLWVPALALALVGLTGTVPGASAETNSSGVASAGEIVIATAGDIANCSHDNDEATAQLLDSIAPDRVLTLGDNAYSSGTDAQFAGCYHPTWGRHKDKTHPSPGNHDYQTGGATGYFNYFGTAAGDPNKGYYAFDLGAWRFYALNSNCSAVSCAAGSAQEQWLRSDLAQHPRTCTAAFMHHPRFASGHSSSRRNNPSMAALFQAFYDGSGDLWLVGHNHQYERLTRLDPSGAIDLERGIRLFVVGTGGAALYEFGAPITGSEVRNNTTHGVLKLTFAKRATTGRSCPSRDQRSRTPGRTSAAPLSIRGTLPQSSMQVPTRRSPGPPAPLSTPPSWTTASQARPERSRQPGR